MNRNSILVLLIVLASAGSVLMACSYDDTSSPLAFFVVFGLVACFGVLLFSFTAADLVTRLRTVLVVYCLNIAFSCVLFFYYMDTYGAPYEYGGTDDATFDRQAHTLAGMPWTSIEDMRSVVMYSGTGSWHASDYYVFVVGGIHKAAAACGMTPHTLNPRFLNSLVIGWISVLVYVLALPLAKSPQRASQAGYFCGLFPHMVFESAHIYRDTLFSLGILAIVTLVVSWFRNAKRKPLNWHIRAGVMLLAAMWATSLLREHFLAVFAILVFGLVAVIWHAELMLRILAFSGAVLVLLAGLIILGHHDTLMASVDELWAATELDYSNYSEHLGGGSEGIGATIFRLPLLISLPLRLAYASVNPVPSLVSPLSEQYHQFGAVVWFLCLPFLVRGCLRAFRVVDPETRITYRAIAVSFLFFYCMVALTTIQDRQFTMYIPLASVLIVTEMQRANSSPVKTVAFMGTIGFLLTIVYVFIKLF